jgi:hypothetical protein
MWPKLKFFSPLVETGHTTKEQKQGVYPANNWKSIYKSASLAN